MKTSFIAVKTQKVPECPSVDESRCTVDCSLTLTKVKNYAGRDGIPSLQSENRSKRSTGLRLAWATFRLVWAAQ